MRLTWWKNSRTLAGVDIGSTSVKVVQLARKGKTVRLVGVGVADLERGSVSDGEIRNTIAVAGTLRRLFEESGINVRDVATSIAGHAVLVKRIVVPEAEGDALRDAVMAEAQRQISSDLSETSIDYQVLGPGTAPQNLEVMLVAVGRDKVENHVRALRQAGLNPMILDLDAFAVQSAFEAAYQPPAGHTVALFNLGASLININIVRDGVPLFTRDLPADAQYTAALQKSLNMSAEEAEELKKGRDGAAVTETFLGSIAAAREAFLDGFAAEVQRTVTYLRQLTGPAAAVNVDAAYVSGGVSALPGLCDRLHRELNAPVEILDPLRGMRASDVVLDMEHLAEISPRVAVAAGLALRSFDEQ